MIKKLNKKEEINLTELTAINPLDGRYRTKTKELAPFVSEYGLIKTRIEIEAKYLVALSDIGILRPIKNEERIKLMSFGENISFEVAEKVKKIETETRHDVKAMERAFRSMLEKTSLSDVIEKVHIGLTSEDINNLANRLMLKRATENIIIPQLNEVIHTLTEWAEKYKATAMLARTHGQGGVPTTLGHEMVVFANRLSEQTEALKKRNLTGKFSGAVGVFNALVATYPDVNWIKFSKDFIKSFGLEPNMATTQINTYEDMVEYFQNYQRINSILLDLDQDMWRYISDHWIIQKPKKGEVGSSTMTQKVNPIDFENSEGNLGVSNAFLEHLSRKLPISRLQRDLSDSTVIRNVGSALGYSLVAFKSIREGMNRISPDLAKIKEALDYDWGILGEAVQTVLREEGVKDPYSMIVEATRGIHIGKDEWLTWVNSLPITNNQKRKIRHLTPQNYTGEAVRLTEETLAKIRATY